MVASLLVLVGAPDPTASAATLASSACVPAGTTAISGVVNTYWAGTGTHLVGSTSITRDLTAAGAAHTLAAGDYVLLLQTQDAQVNLTDSDAYGDGVVGVPGNGVSDLGNTGRYEYNWVTSVSGTTVNLAKPLTTGFDDADAATATLDRKRSFQIIRVPVYANATATGQVHSSAWDGAKGGVLAIHANGTLDMGGQIFYTNGEGFRGGLRQVDGSAAPTSFGWASGSAAVGGSKGEGIAGTPADLSNPGGLGATAGGPGERRFGRGGPGNAGGGGNNHNSGGGGGSNAGTGGVGGEDYYLNAPVGGEPGRPVVPALDRIILGGGGGAGHDNNGVGTSGGNGGGAIVLTANALTNTSDLQALGSAVAVSNPGPGNDGGGGGGAGGAIIVATRTGGFGATNMYVSGAKGVDAVGSGGGGGGGGGYVLRSDASGNPILAGGNAGGPALYAAAPGTAGVSAVDVAGTRALIAAPCDWSDLPSAKYGRVSHQVNAVDARIGTTLTDTEDQLDATNITLDANNQLDDATGDDEDAWTTPPALSQTATTFAPAIAVANPTALGYTLAGWVDWDDDGFEASEYSSSPVAPGATSVALSWSVPAATPLGSKAVRLRISSTPLTAGEWASHSSDGEVEDQRLIVAADPGGLGQPDGLAVWLRADAAVTASGGNVSSWTNLAAQGAGSVEAVSQATVANQPTVTSGQLNFNPAVVTTGNQMLQDPSAAVADMLGVGENWLFVVRRQEVGGSGYDLAYASTLNYGPTSKLSMEQNTAGHVGGVVLNPPPLAGQGFKLETIGHDGTGSFAFRDGLQVASGAAVTQGTAGTGVLDVLNFGGQNPGHIGAIAEVLQYRGALTAADRNRIWSYLALKYGITLDQGTPTDYTSPTGVAFWSAGANAGYANDIAGIGVERSEALSQLRSRSVNPDDVVRMGAPTAIADSSYLTWGNNNASVAFDGTLAVPAGYQRIGREWRAQRTGTTGSVTVEIKVDDPGFSLPAAGNYALLVDQDNDGSYVDETPVSLNDSGTGADTLGGDGYWSAAGIGFGPSSRFTIATLLTPTVCEAGRAFYSFNGSTVQRVDPLTGVNSTTATLPAIPYNGSLSFNHVDGYLYSVSGSIAGSQHLWRIGTAGYADLGVIPYATNAVGHGVALRDGNQLFYNEGSGQWVVLNVAGATPTVVASSDVQGVIPLPAAGLPNDLALSPADNRLWGVEGNTLISINFSVGGPAPTLDTQVAIPGSLGLGAGAGFTPSGRMFVKQKSSTNVYAVNPTTAAATLQTTAGTAAANYAGGATCAFGVGVEKAVTPAVDPAGDPVTYAFTLYNRTASPQTLTVSDNLPLGQTWGTVTPASPGGGTVTVSGQVLTIAAVTVPANSTVGFTAGATPALNLAAGPANNQAQVSGIVGNHVATVTSDDPATGIVFDPTTLTITAPRDEDGDAIPSLIEGTGDFDGDGAPNFNDPDADGDTIADSIERGPDGFNPVDTDGDGSDDYLDRDSDGDTIPDSTEGTTDTDGDTVPNYLDLNSDGDPYTDAYELTGDADVDGIANYLDHAGLDADGDGIPDSVEVGPDPLNPVDTDGDRTPDILDRDADNDTIPDSVEGAADADGDGLANFRDLDSDGDGLPDRDEGTADTDGDGLANYLDLDSDGDTIPDAVEGLGNPGGGIGDVDGDGVPDRLDLDSDGDGIADSVELAGDPDADGSPNYIDLDSDGDKIADRVEGLVDTDGDAIANFLDLDSDADGLSDLLEGTGDVDRDGVPNYLDPSGGDADGDGISDLDEGTGDTDGDGVSDALDTDADGDGISDREEGGGDADGDGIPDNLDTTATVDVAASVSAGPSDLLAGANTTVNITISNLGAQRAPNARLTLSLASGFTFVSGEVAGSTIAGTVRVPTTPQAPSTPQAPPIPRVPTAFASTLTGARSLALSAPGAGSAPGTGSLAGGCSVVGVVVTCSAGSLAAGRSATFRLVLRSAPQLPRGRAEVGSLAAVADGFDTNRANDVTVVAATIVGRTPTAEVPRQRVALTGTNPGPAVLWALALVAFGAGLGLLRRRRRRAGPTSSIAGVSEPPC